MALILDEILLRLGLHISSTGYLEDGAPRFIEVTEYDNTGFDRKVVEDEDGEEDGEEVVTDSEKKASKKRARCKAKRDAVQARALLLATMPGSSTSASASVPVLGSSIAMPGLSAPASVSVPVSESSAAMPKSSAAMLESSAAMPGSSVAVPKLSAAVPGLSAPASASISVPGSSTLVLPSAPMFPVSSPLLFPALFSPKTPTPNLAVGKGRLDDTISGWSGKSKRASLEELCSGRIKRAALEETFSPRVPLFLPLFPSSGISERKVDKTFINTWPLANNHAKEEVDLSFALYGYPPTVKLNKPWQIELLE